jgi:hypothetical protein
VNGLSLVTVNGKAVALSFGGAWKLKVPVKPGANTVTAVATNVFGNSSKAQIKVVGAPVLSKVHESHRRWHESGAKPVGTKFFFKLSQSARITFAFTVPRTGRLVKGKCVRRTNKNRKKPKCALTVGTLSFNAHAGNDSRSFKGGLGGGKKLKPGKYTLVITAKHGGAVSAPQTLTFTILT